MEHTLWVWHIFAHVRTNPLTLFKNIRTMCWYHDGAERVLGSKSLENELFGQL